MGKQWDKAIPSVDIWKECLRVLKPGAFAFVMCIPRQDCLSRMIINLEDAGFNISFTSLYHVFAQGFPKATNISKMIDRKLGAKRKKIGKKKAGLGSGKTYAFTNNNVTPGEVDITLPATPEAQALDGSYAGFQPKPALEVILVAMKPLSEKTYVGQALKNRKGVVWFDNGRIPFQNNKDKELHTRGVNCKRKSKLGIFQQSEQLIPDKINIQRGRFPADLLVSDDVLNDGRDRKVGKLSPGMGKGYWVDEGNIFRSGCNPLKEYGGDLGSFSRYFSLDSWWNKRIKNLPDNVKKTFPFFIVPKASKAEKNKGCEGLKKGKTPFLPSGAFETNNGNKQHTKMQNYHPTVKPIKLMSYLITIGSRKGDVILDPFAGSGTTLISAKILGRKYMGYEINKDYHEIAIKRLQAIVYQMEFELGS